MNSFLSYIDNNYIQFSNCIHVANTIDMSSNIYLVYDIYYKALRLRELKNINMSIDLFNKCIDIINTQTNKTVFNNVLYECYINLAIINYDIDINNKELIKSFYLSALEVFPDRSEPFYYYGIYCNKMKLYDEAYSYLLISKNKKYYDFIKKYPTTQYTCYDKYVNEDLINCCFNLNMFEECEKLIYEILSDPEFNSKVNYLIGVLMEIHKKRELINNEITTDNNNEIITDNNNEITTDNNAYNNMYILS
jgi:hypothetical protein